MILPVGPDELIATSAVPVTEPADAVIVVVPSARAVNIPEGVIVPAEPLLLVHVTAAVIELPDLSVRSAVKAWSEPATIETDGGETVIEDTTGVPIVYVAEVTALGV